MKASIKKNYIYSTLYQILTLVIPFITAPYISRVIGADGVGIYSYTTSIQTYFVMFAALGVISYGTREISRSRDNKHETSKLFWEIEILTIFTSLICLIVWGILIVFSNEYKLYYIILTMGILNTLFDISWLYSGLEQFKYTIIQNSIFKILGVISLFLFVKESNDVGLYIFIMSASTLLGTMSMWLYLPKFIEKVQLKELKVFRHFKETLVYFIPTIATSIYTVLDKTLIGIITKNVSENGYYEQATKIINMMKALAFASLNTVLGSRMSYLFKENKEKEIKEKIDFSVNYIMFMGIGICFGLIGIADRFVPMFFGQGYEKVSLLIKMMSPVVVIIGLSNCLGSQYYTPAGYRKKSSNYIIIGAICNLILNLLLIPKFASQGAIIATIIAEFVISLLYLVNCNKFYTTKQLINSSYKKVIAGIVMLIFIQMFNFLNMSNLIIIALQVLFGIIIYVLVIVVLKDEFIYAIINEIKGKIKGVDNINERL